MPAFDMAISLIEAVFTFILQRDKLITTLLPAIFLLAYLVPLCIKTLGVNLEIGPSLEAAKGLWSAWLEAGSEVMKGRINEGIKARLKTFMEDTTVIPL